jgi:hypothetical protein
MHGHRHGMNGGAKRRRAASGTYRSKSPVLAAPRRASRSSLFECLALSLARAGLPPRLLSLSPPCHLLLILSLSLPHPPLPRHLFIGPRGDAFPAGYSSHSSSVRMALSTVQYVPTALFFRRAHPSENKTLRRRRTRPHGAGPAKRRAWLATLVTPDQPYPPVPTRQTKLRCRRPPHCRPPIAAAPLGRLLSACPHPSVRVPATRSFARCHG